MYGKYPKHRVSRVAVALRWLRAPSSFPLGRDMRGVARRQPIFLRLVLSQYTSELQWTPPFSHAARVITRTATHQGVSSQ